MINKRMKCIISMLCMIPFLAIARESEDQRIQQLQDALQTKKTELFNLERMIASKENHINVVVNNMRYLFSEIRDYFDNKEDQKAFDDETSSFERAISRMATSDQYDKELMNTEFFSDCEHHRRDFHRMKFAFIRIAMELTFLNDLFDSYNLCLQQLFIIKSELKNTKQG